MNDSVFGSPSPKDKNATLEEDESVKQSIRHVCSSYFQIKSVDHVQKE